MQAQTVSGGHQASPQMLAALRMLRAVFGSPGNPFVGDRAVVEFFAQYHFLHFARLFHDLPDGGHSLVLCKAHLQVGTHLARESGSCVCQPHVHDISVTRLWPQKAQFKAAHWHLSFLTMSQAAVLEDCSLQDSLGFANAEASEVS